MIMKFEIDISDRRLCIIVKLNNFTEKLHEIDLRRIWLVLFQLLLQFIPE